MSLTIASFDAAWWPYLFIFLGGTLANGIWRVLGVSLAGRMREDSEGFVLVKSIATALVAGVIGELVLFPGGSLGTTPMALRIATLVVGFAVFRLTRNNLLLGVVAGEVVFVAGALALT